MDPPNKSGTLRTASPQQSPSTMQIKKRVQRLQSESLLKQRCIKQMCAQCDQRHLTFRGQTVTSQHTHLSIRSPHTLGSDAAPLVMKLHPDPGLIKNAPLEWTHCDITGLGEDPGPEGLFGSGLDSAPAPVHRHRLPLIQILLGRLQQDGQTAVRHLALLHGAHQLHRK